MEGAVTGEIFVKYRRLDYLRIRGQKKIENQSFQVPKMEEPETPICSLYGCKAYVREFSHPKIDHNSFRIPPF